MRPVTAFSFGYWGWGNATRELVAAIDAVEKSRGFGPPIFVDVRISRSVRAVGFRDDTFEQLVGQARYRWMRGLGNLSVVNRSGPRIQIAQPEAAGDLVELVAEAAHRKRRVLFYCSCEWPGVERAGNNCHRATVARLVREAARDRALAPLETIEWPGGDAAMLEVAVDRGLLQAIRRGRTSLPLAGAMPVVKYAGLPWGSTVRLHSGEDELWITSGPARYTAGMWQLPVLQRIDGGSAAASAVAAGHALRCERGYEGSQLGDGPGGMGTSDATVYTIAHVDKLRTAKADGGRGAFSERTRWTSGAKLLREARIAGLELPIVFADATDCSALLYRAVLSNIVLGTDSTVYTFDRLRRLRGDWRPQDLALLSTGKNIAPGYIRPYALCRTPSFLR